MSNHLRHSSAETARNIGASGGTLIIPSVNDRASHTAATRLEGYGADRESKCSNSGSAVYVRVLKTIW
jgi:hypothetical protein